MLLLDSVTFSSCCAVYDYQVTNSEGRVFDKLVFFSWCVMRKQADCFDRVGSMLRTVLLPRLVTAQCLAHSSSPVLTCKLLTNNRSPDTARIRTKMMYASTKDFFKRWAPALQRAHCNAPPVTALRRCMLGAFARALSLLSRFLTALVLS